MLTPSDISAASTHDLWTEARNFKVNLTRPTPTTVEIQVIRPLHLSVTNGYIVLLNTSPINATNYPEDGQEYTPSVNWLEPGSLIQNPGGARVVGAYYGILDKPMPEGIPVIANATESTTGYQTAFVSSLITVENTSPTTIYYASVHAVSSVLQYYPIGVSSYPLDGGDQGALSSTYAGNIPSLPSAPTDPSPGMVYHDLQLNIIQYFDANSDVWIPTRSDTIVSGPYNPGVLGQVYFWSGGSAIMIFNGREWVKGSATNVQVRVPITTHASGWAPLNKVSSNIRLPDTPLAGDFVYDFTLQRMQYWDGVTWVYPSSSNVLFDPGTGGLISAFVMPMTVEAVALANPYIGQLFYNTSTRQLNAWTGTEWKVANTDQQGTTLSEKINVGTDGSYDERVHLMKVLQLQLGYPQFCVELTEEQFNVAIDNALDTYRQLSSGAYKNAYIIYTLKANQQTYFLNSPIDKTDRIVDINKVHRMNVLGAGVGSDNIFMQHFLTDYYYSTGHADILSSSLLAGLSDEFERLFAGNLTFLWDEPTRELMFTRKISRDEKVIVEAMIERPEQELLVDRWCRQFIQNWALAELKMSLGMIRSKFSSGTPGAGGSITLNGELLISEARQDMAELKQGLLDYEYGGHIGMGNVSFLWG